MEVKICDKIRIIYMDGEPDYTDKVGEVYSIDDMGQIHGSWGGCALIPGVDKFEVIRPAHKYVPPNINPGTLNAINVRTEIAKAGDLIDEDTPF